MIVLWIWLCIPLITWFGNLLATRRNRPTPLFVFAWILCWVLQAVSILVMFEGYKHELLEYDLNGDGRVRGAELTVPAQAVRDKITNDAGRMFGPILAAPISAVWVALNFVILYGCEWLIRPKRESPNDSLNQFASDISPEDDSGLNPYRPPNA